MDCKKLLRGQGEHFLNVVSSLSRGLEEGIDLVLVLELDGSVSGNLTAVRTLDIQIDI